MKQKNVSKDPESSGIKNPRGSALVICLMSLALLSVLGVSAQLASTTNQHIAANLRKQAQAFYLSEAGLQYAVARVKSNPLYRGESSNIAQGSLSMGGQNGSYSVTFSDSTDDGNGQYNPLLPGATVKLVSVGRFPSTGGTLQSSTQQVEVLLKLSPGASGTDADSPYAAVVTTGANTGSGTHVVNGYNQYGVQDNANMIQANQPSLPTVNQDALKAFADFSFSSLGNAQIDGPLSVQTDFWKDAPANTQPWVIRVTGNLNISGSRHLYGIIFVEGTTVTLSGSVRIHGVIYAPNATVQTTINGGGSPWDQPVMGQVICGSGGVHASGNHADVQLVPEYVDAFNFFGRDTVDAAQLPGSWKQS